LRDRFGLTLKLNYYKESELKTILQRTAKVYNNYIEESALTELFFLAVNNDQTFKSVYALQEITCTAIHSILSLWNTIF
ncbi:hypothetical protein OC715_02470, partial ['Bituminaria bituminosa' little leaf phytoplasma]